MFTYILKLFSPARNIAAKQAIIKNMQKTNNLKKTIMNDTKNVLNTSNIHMLIMNVFNVLKKLDTLDDFVISDEKEFAKVEVFKHSIINDIKNINPESIESILKIAPRNYNGKCYWNTDLFIRKTVCDFFAKPEMNKTYIFENINKKVVDEVDDKNNIQTHFPNKWRC